MNYLQSEQASINELGMLSIPLSMQEQSSFKAFNKDEGMITLVRFSIEGDGITLMYHDKTCYEKHKAKKCKHIVVIDELGRVALPREHREELNISPRDVLVVSLIDDSTMVVCKE